MSFLTPTALALGALSIPVILLYMLRLRRRETPVSSTLLWQQVIQDREANAPWQRLRRNLLLLLQLLILAGLVIALARPFVEVPTVTTGKVALLIDASASMNATDVQPTRFEVARQQALTFINSINSQDQVAVIRVAGGPEQVVNYTNDQNALRDGINKMQVSQASADWVAALTLAAAGATGSDKFTTVIIGDGGLPSGIGNTYGDVKFIPIGKSAENVAISALATGTDPVNGPQLYGRITNYGTQSADVVFSVKLDGALFNASTYTVAAGQYTDVVVTKLPETFHQVEADLTRPLNATTPDYLPLDDVAYAVFTPSSIGQALLITPQNKFLEQGFASLADWQIFLGQPNTALPTKNYDLYIFDGSLPPVLPAGNMLLVNPPNTSSINDLFTVGAETKDASLITVKANDPRTRFLDFKDVNIRQFETITQTDAQKGKWPADTLVGANGGPLVLAGTYNGHQVAVISFDLHDSDLALKIAWPILLSDLTQWYRVPRIIDVQGSLAPGKAITIQPPPDADKVTVKHPDGTITDLKLDANLSSLIFADTQALGIYTVDTYKSDNLLQEAPFAINMFDPDESSIAVKTPSFITTTNGTTNQAEIGQREFWPFIALAALLILMIEWYIYYRRAIGAKIFGPLRAAVSKK